MFTNDITFGLKICIEAINILFSLELAYFIFINRNRRSKDFPLNIKAANVSSKISIGLSLFFFSFNIGLISYILQIRTWYYSDLLVLPEKFNGELFNNFFRFFVLIAFSALFLLNSDLFGKLIYRNIVISTQIILFISLYLSNFTGLIIVCLLFPLAAIHFKILWNLGQITRDRLHFQFKLLFVGFLFLFFGTIVSINLFDPTNFFLESIIPDLLYLIGILLIGLSYLSIPSICDAFAISFVDGLYITKNNGEILISHQFNKAILSSLTDPASQHVLDSNEIQIDDDTFTSSLIGIDGILYEISSAQGSVKMVKHQNKILLIERSDRYIGVMITRMDLLALRTKIQLLLSEIENYHPSPSQEFILSIETKNSILQKIDLWYTEQISRLTEKFKLV